MKFYRFFIGIVFLSLAFFCLICGRKEIQRSRSDFVYLSFNIFVFEATQAEEKLEFTPFPTAVSTRVIDKVFHEAEGYFESLKSVSSFNQLMLKKSFTQKMKLSLTKPLKIEAVKTISSTSENGYQVDITPWQMEEEIVQLRVAVKKGGEFFFNTDISSPMDKSVVIGRMMDQTNKALLVTSSVVEETDSSVILTLDTAKSTFVPELNKPIKMDSEPVALDYIHPHYPKSAKKDGIEGTVWLRVLVSENGDVVDAVVLKSLREDLDKAALENAWEIKYQPAISQNRPIAVWIVYSSTFKLE